MGFEWDVNCLQLVKHVSDLLENLSKTTTEWRLQVNKDLKVVTEE